MKTIMYEQKVDFRQCPNLKLLLWDNKKKVLDAREAFDILDRRLAKYLGNNGLTNHEKELVRYLADRFGGGICNDWKG